MYRVAIVDQPVDLALAIEVAISREGMELHTILPFYRGVKGKPGQSWLIVMQDIQTVEAEHLEPEFPDRPS